ncbi:alpha/beta hydrolase-fold protein [uncultured Gelidibacter sp.]|uniref:alpha/beta hydrolase n=1 Tax=uncultured Gelidibacter sp. TaxID=259318 RepID=UPI00260F9B87|nr:alpha/beta hydrolase-fold protein [uncultured Gelidibacter sp.]
MKFIKLFVVISFAFCTLGYGQHTVSKQVSTFTIEATQLQTQKKIWVYLPKNYSETTLDYPVFYMQDAQNLFDAKTSYAGEWQIDEYLDSLTNQNVIIIGIEHGNEKRMEELTPFPHDTYGGGKADMYLDFIINTLKPQIDATYRTLKDPKDTTIFGSSLGGLLSFYAVIKHPEIFGNAGVFSPSFWFSNAIFDLVSKSEISQSSRFYFLSGSNESETMVPDQQKMVALLLEKGVPGHHIKSTIIEGGQHNEALWRDHFPEAYQWIIKN